MKYLPLVFLATVLSIFGWFLYEMSPAQQANGESVPVVIQPGSPGRNDLITVTSNDLLMAGLVRNEILTSYVIYVVTFGRDQVIKSGTYYIPRGVWTFRVILKLLGRPDIEKE